MLVLGSVVPFNSIIMLWCRQRKWGWSAWDDNSHLLFCHPDAMQICYHVLFPLAQVTNSPTLRKKSPTFWRFNMLRCGRGQFLDVDSNLGSENRCKLPQGGPLRSFLMELYTTLINDRTKMGNWVYNPTYYGGYIYNSIFNWLGPTLQYPCPFFSPYFSHGWHFSLVRSQCPGLESPCRGSFY